MHILAKIIIDDIEYDGKYFDEYRMHIVHTW